MALYSRVQALCNATGLSAKQLILREPGLLSLEHTRVATRMEALRSALGGLEVGPLLRRAPRLLSRSPDHIRNAMGELNVVSQNLSVNASTLVNMQPTLLLYSSISESIAPKLERVRILTTEEEWERLALRGGSLARIMTASLHRIERLSRVPGSVDGGGRPVTRILQMSDKMFEAWLAAQRADAKP